MTVTLLWAEVPDSAFIKWNWAVKGILFSCLIPLFLRNRVHVEAFIWTVVLSGMAHCLTFGAKVLLSGGGYGAELGLVQISYGYGEGSTLGMFSVALIPMCLYLYHHQTLMPFQKLTKFILVICMVAAILTSVGTYSRTGLVSLVVLGLLLFLTTKRKFSYAILITAAIFMVSLVTGDVWMDRMSTIGDGTEGSAMGRVAVWHWTLDYIKTHPLGGSFDVFRINEFTYVTDEGYAISIKGKAFHSIYFEILGELGIPGIILFFLILFLTWRGYQTLKNAIVEPDKIWIKDLSSCLLLSLAVYLAGGAFIGIGFQSFFFYVVALSVTLINVYHKDKCP
jgi:probable O-glycosylation ligase (exosortase A-associated)